MGSVLFDLRQSLRSLARSRAYTLTASVTLALGLGATIASLNLTYWLLRQPVGGITRQDRLIAIWSGSQNRGFLSAANGFPKWVSNDEYRSLVERFSSAGQIAGYQRNQVSVGLPGATPRLVNLEVVSWNYFPLLGVLPQLGSLARPLDMPKDEGAAVISDQLWSVLFDRRRDALGSRIVWNRQPVTVIGITPPAFRGPQRLSTTDLWFPKDSGAAAGPSYSQFVARLEPGVTLKRAETQLNTVLGGQVQVFSGLSVPMTQRPAIAQFLELSVAGSLLVLLIACANVANLLLFRGLARRPETALHRTLGASAGTVVRKHIIDAMALALPAMLMGIPLSIVLTRLLGTVRLTRWGEPFGSVPISWSNIALAALAAMLVAGATGVIPALVASRTEPLLGVQDMRRGRGAKRLRQVFATTQMALSLSLVVAMFLMVGTMLRLRSIDLGFEPRGVMLLNTDPGDAGYQPNQAAAYYRDLLARLQGAPEIASAAVAGGAPLSGGGTVYVIRFTETPGPKEDLRVRENRVSGEYFELLRMRLLEGRTFTTAEVFPDSTTPRKIILSKSVAVALFGDRPTLGTTLFLQGRRHEVVGVVADSHWDHVEPAGGWVEDPRLMVFTPFDGALCFGPGRCMLSATFLVRSRVSDKVATDAIRRIASEAEPLLPPYKVATLQANVDLSLLDRIVLVRMMTILGILATGLAAVGVYGLIAYSVASRRRDIGIRIALGARAAAVAGLLLREVFLVGCAGIVIGLAGAVILSRLIASHLYGVTPVDAATYAFAATVLLGTALLAAVPAIRSATQVDPAVTLRSD